MGSVTAGRMAKILLATALLSTLAYCTPSYEFSEDTVVPEDPEVEDQMELAQEDVDGGNCKFMNGAVNQCRNLMGKGEQCTKLKNKCRNCHGDCADGKSKKCKLRDQHCDHWVEDLIPCERGVKTFPDGTTSTTGCPTCVDDDNAKYGPYGGGSCANLRKGQSDGYDISYNCNRAAGSFCRLTCNTCWETCVGDCCDDHSARYGGNADGEIGNEDDGDCANLRFRKAVGQDISSNCDQEAGEHCKLTCGMCPPPPPPTTAPPPPPPPVARRRAPASAPSACPGAIVHFKCGKSVPWGGIYTWPSGRTKCKC